MTERDKPRKIEKFPPPSMGMELLREGDEGMWMSIFISWNPSFVKTGSRFVGSDGEAHVQDVWEKAFRILTGPEPILFESYAELNTYMRAMVVNRAIDFIRREVKRDERELASLRKEPFKANNVFSDTSAGSVIETLARLVGNEDAHLLILTSEGYSAEEISEILGVKVGTVKSRRSRVRALLRGNEVVSLMSNLTGEHPKEIAKREVRRGRMRF